MVARNRVAGLLAATLSAACWGAATVMSKGALDAAPPIMLLVIQLGGSVAFLWTLLLLRGLRAAAIRDAFRVAWLGLLEPGLAYAIGLVGLAQTHATDATLIGSSEAIMIALLSSMLLGERLTLGFLALSGIALAGLLLTVGIDDGGARGWLGDGLIGLATLVAAFYVVLSSRLVGDRDPILVVACQHLVAGAFALLLLPIEILGADRVTLGDLSISGWALAVGSGIVQYALAFSLYLAAMRSIATRLAGAFLYLAPVIGIAGAAFALGESFSMLQVVGSAVTIAALVLLSRIDATRATPDIAVAAEACRS